MAQRAPRRAGAPRTAPRDRRPSRAGDDEGIIPVLAKTVRRVEAAAQRGKVRPSGRTAYQVVALLVREERARVKVDMSTPEAERAAVLTRLDGIATILAMTAARDTSTEVVSINLATRNGRSIACPRTSADSLTMPR